MLTTWWAGLLLCLVQFAAALPWLAALDLATFRRQTRKASAWAWAGGGLAGGGLALGFFIAAVGNADRLDTWGRIYAALLQAQLLADFFVLVLWLMLRLWPRGGAIAQASFREGIRQPLFWILAGFGSVLLLLYIILPFYSFGDDFKFMKLLGFDTLMLFPAVFGVLGAGMSITEEIEGRTAITLISKPVSRRQFLLGKFAGILLAGLALAGILAWVMQWCLYFRPLMNPGDDATDPIQAQLEPSLSLVVQNMASTPELLALGGGIADWLAGMFAVMLGLTIGYCQVMILTSVAAALATRLPMAVNLVTCLVFYFLGHLAPVLLQVTARLQTHHAARHGGAESAPLALVDFMAQVFDTILPALEYFNLGPAVIRDLPLPLGEYSLYILSVAGYSIMYTAIALLFGLILFEDRDLA